ncbi:MAG: ORF6C domain-containing protein [Chloroflexota bacterium]|nr:ORF6C domain-containing protein [Chloroflexota bacterium]
MSDDTPAPRPREQLPIPLFDSAVLAVRGANGQIFLSLRDICAVLGLVLSGQRRRIRGNSRLTLQPFRVIIQGQLRNADFLLLDDVPLWLLTVQINRVSDDVRTRVDYIQSYLVTSVQRAFGELTGLTLGDQPSSAIEDLRELDRIDEAFQRLADVSSRQDRAAHVVRDILDQLREMRDRVQQLETLAKSRISPQERGTIYQMVQTWGEARAARTANLEAGAAIRTCWREVNARFGVSTYTDLPAARYDEIVQFIKEQYHALTGADLGATEQGTMEL